MKIWQVYWRDENRNTYCGYVKASGRNAAYDITQGMLRKGCRITAVYEASENWITPQSLTINFTNTTDYVLF